MLSSFYPVSFKSPVSIVFPNISVKIISALAVGAGKKYLIIIEWIWNVLVKN